MNATPVADTPASVLDFPRPPGCVHVEEPIRVCFMIDALTNAGTETQLLALIRCLDRSRVLPHLCLLRGADKLSRALEPPDCPVLRLNAGSLAHPGTVRSLLRLARFLRARRIEVLQVYFPDSTYFGVPAALFAGVRRVVRTRNNLNHWMTPTHRLLGRLLNRFVSVTVANCAACRDAVLADEKPSPDSVVVLENGVDLSRFPAVDLPGLPVEGRQAQRVGIVANLRPVKGLDVFVRAAALIASARPNVLFEVAGDGDQRPDIEQLGARLGLGNQLVLRGSLTDIPEFLSTLDVAVLSSRAEGMSNSVLEYMAAARAIVATTVGATPQLIDDGIQGLLVRPDDPAALAAAIDRFLADPALACRMGGEARRRVEERYSRSAMVRRFEDFYKNLARSSDATELA